MSGIRRLRDDPKESEWWHLLQKKSIKDPNSHDGMAFCRDYRVPHKIFEYIYHKAVQATKPDQTPLWPPVDGIGNETHPLCLKILSTLYILAQGEVFRSIEGRTNIDEETLHRFFHQFTRWMVEQFYKKWIVSPDESYEQMNLVLKDYEWLGFPGAIGSMGK